MSVVANVAINVDSRNAVSKLREVQSQSQATERAVGGLGAALGKLAVAAAALQAARFVFAKTAELESQTRSLQVLTGSAEKAGQIIKELQQLGAVTPFTSTELIDSAKRLQAFGVEADKVVETTRRLADVSGATGAELQGLVTAYGQVQAKGRLQGEELLQFQERGVALQQELRKQYNLSGEEFQDALSKGKISAEAVEFAIQSLTEAGGKYANGAIAQSDTLNGRFSTLQDGIEEIARTIGAALTPAIKAVLNEAIFAINTINQLLATGARARSFGLDQRARKQILDQALDEAVDIVGRNAQTGRRIANNFERGRQIQEIAAQRERDLIEAYGIRTGQVKPQVTAPQGQRALPPLGAGTAGAGRKGKTDAEKAAEKAAREAEKLAQEIQRSLELGDRLGTEFSRQVLLLGEANEIEQKRLQIQFEYEDRAKQIGELKNAEQRTNLTDLNNEIKRLETLELQTEELKKQLEEYYKRAGLKLEDPLGGGAGAFRTDINLMPGAAEQQMAKYREELDALTNPINMAVTGANAIGDAFGTAFQDIATGAKSTQDALADAFKSIGSAFISMATEIIAKQIAMIVFQTILKALGGGGGDMFSGAGPYQLPSGGGFAEGFSMPKLFATGGFVTGPTSAVIGEGGEPEYIIPASKMRGAMSRYSAGARGSSVIPGNGGEPAAASGGVATMEPIDVRYSVERINNVDYVTADQFQRGMAQAAQQGAIQGERRAMRSLKNSAATRRGVGI